MDSAQIALVVDDDDAIQYYHSVCLDQMGIESITVGTGHEALDQLAARDFDIVLLDVGLPDMSGLEVLGSIRSQGPGTCVIMISGLHEAGLPAQAVASLGADLFMTKPCRPAEVRTAVEEALARRDQARAAAS